MRRNVTGKTRLASIVIARATKGEWTSAGARFCEILREISNGVTADETVLLGFSSRIIQRITMNVTPNP